MKTHDMETVLAAVELARHILGEYIEPGSRDAAVTLERLMMTLDDKDVVKALERLRRRRTIRLVE